MKRKRKRKVPRIDLTKKSCKEISECLFLVKKLLISKKVKVNIKRPAKY